MKFLIGLGIILAATFSWAGPRVNNGGGVWTCRNNDEDGALRWGLTHDLMELHYKERETPTLRNFGRAQAWEIYGNLLTEIFQKYPQLQELLEKHPLELANKVVMKRMRLDVIQDAQIYARPPHWACIGGSLQYEQGADFLLDNTLLIDRDLWESPALSAIDKAALLMHEHIYYVTRAEYGDQTSLRAQGLVALLFSTESESSKRIAMQDILSLDYHVGERQVSEVALYNVELSCRLMVIDLYADTVREFMLFEDMAMGAVYQRAEGPYRFYIRTNTVDGLPEQMKVSEEEIGAEVESDAFSMRSAFAQKRRYSISLKNKKSHRMGTLECWSK